MTLNSRSLSIGPVLFHWPEQKLRDFWYAIADEAPVDTVYIGEVVCAKRAPFYRDSLADVVERLGRGGKKVVWSTLAEVVTKIDRRLVADICELLPAETEANDASALYFLSGSPHRIGPYLNTYNEATLRRLAAEGATHVTLPAELPAAAIATLCDAAARIGVGIEVQVFGRVSLALSARCYHARAHGRTKDNCQFVCEQDPDGMDLYTRTEQPFLSVNGIQTLSFRYLNLAVEIAELSRMGVGTFRLSPHQFDMVQIAQRFRDLLDGTIEPGDVDAMLANAGIPQPTMNGFYHRKPGMEHVVPGTDNVRI